MSILPAVLVTFALSFGCSGDVGPEGSNDADGVGDNGDGDADSDGDGDGDGDGDVDSDGDADNGDADRDADIEHDGRVWQPIRLELQGVWARELDDDPNPFLDYRLQVDLSGPSDQQYSVPGFFDGDGEGGGEGDTWVVMFTPDESGRWTYIVSFRSGSGVALELDAESGTPEELDGETGELMVAEPDPSAPGFYGRGRLEPVPGSFYLRTRGDGQYWIKGGTDSPENFLAYAGFEDTSPFESRELHTFAAHEGDYRPGDPDWGGGLGRGIIGALNYLADSGVNSIYVLLMNIGGDGKDVYPYADSIDPRGGDGVNENRHFDIGKLTQWEVVFTHAERRGLHIHFVLNEAEAENKLELDGATLGVERMLYYREMIARFGHHNAITWNLCEEYDLDHALSPDMVRSWAEYLRAVDSYDHPIAVHNARAEAWDTFFGDDRFDAISYQYHQLDQPYGPQVERLRRRSLEAGHPLVIGIDEPYTTGLSEDEAIEQLNNWHFVAGQIYVRKNIIYPVLFSGGNIELILEGTLSNDDFRAYELVWSTMSIARSFLEDNVPFWRMEPADDLLTNEARGALEGGQVLAELGSTYAVYLPSGGTARIDLSDASSDLHLRWFDPRLGRFIGDASLIEGGSTITFGPPPSEEDEDWVVLIEGDDR